MPGDLVFSFEEVRGPLLLVEFRVVEVNPLFGGSMPVFEFKDVSEKDFLWKKNHSRADLLCLITMGPPVC